MISFLRRHRRSLFIGMVAIFLVGTFVGLGGYLFTSADVSESVAVVGDVKIPYMRFNVKVNQYVEAMRSRKMDVSEQTLAEVKQAMLRDMIVDEILYQEAEKIGVRVTDLELAQAVRSVPAFQRDGQFDQALYFQALRFAFRTTPEEFERDQRKSIMASKLKQMLVQSAKILPGELRDEFKRLNGSDKDFDKKKDAFAQELQQTRALDVINAYLRQVTANMEIRSYLDQRERGA